MDQKKTDTKSTKKPSPELTAEGLVALRAARDSIMAEVSKVIVGQQEIVEQLLVALFARGHCLLVGVPGLAKTLLVRTLAQAVDLEFKRVQFTPDLMPSDITGTEVLDQDPKTQERIFRFVRGPIFSNVLLADEINRTPPKTQAALLEAMAENRVTAGGVCYPLQQPFFVLATQNPIEQEGTYPLPEAQLDRFMFLLEVEYPERLEEIAVVRATTQEEAKPVQRVITGAQIQELQALIRKAPVSDYVMSYATDLVRATRPGTPEAPKLVNDYVTWGAGTRAAQYLVLGAKTRALLEGRVNVSCADVRAVALSVLRHRVFTNFNADAEGLTSEKIVEKLIAQVKEPEAKDLPKLASVRA
jgi:MoxR-like ATPase